uniref:MyTH4 domain-containing protein n=1 Tax=Phytophthora ramorum TaxID=164328 RepID=H3HCQ1_PHYRM
MALTFDSIHAGPSLEELAGDTELEHDPDSWEEDDREDTCTESQADVHPGLSLEHIPVDIDATCNSETRGVEECTPDPENKDDDESSDLHRMPFDQLPHLSSEPLRPKNPAKGSKPSIFHKPVEFNLGKRLEWEKKLISTPLTRLPKDQTVVAVQAFRNVSGFMGNRASGKNQVDHCFKLLRNVVPRSPALKDEIYCQLCKQLTRNPSANAVINGWLLLNACLVTFPPSPPLAECLERFISVHIGASGESEVSAEVSAYAVEALASLGCCATHSERKEIPSAAELRALQRHALNDIIVVLADGSVLVMQVSAWTTSRDLAGLVARKLGVCHEKAFALFEMNDDEEEHLVPDHERVMDLYAEWERTHIDVSDLNQKKKKAIEGYYLTYKAYLWVHVDDETAADVSLYYLQAVHNVLKCRYICSLDVAVELASYQLYCQLGNGSTPALNEITNNIHEYIPHALLSASNRAAVAEQVLASWCVQSSQQARLAYLRLCKRQPFYGLTLFHVRNSRHLAVLPSRVNLAINDMGIGILGTDSDEVLAMFPYSDIASWGYSANSFVFNVVRGREETEYSFKTVQQCLLQGKSINDNVVAYVDYIISLTAIASD